MMYFLVSDPPKTFIIVSPAFSALSVKWAIGAGSFAFCGSVGACAVTRLLNSRTNNAVPNSIFFMAISRPLRCGVLGWLLPLRQQEIADEIAFSGRRRFRTFVGILRRIFHVTRATVGLTEQASRLDIARAETKGFLKLGGCFGHST